jgi:4-hydroxy-tetrahydrodipicolinate synthase
MAVKHGCAAVLICPPSYYKNIKEEGVIAYYREIIQRVAHPDLRVLLYHFPRMSGVPITLHIIEVLRKEFPHIVVGIKESEGNTAFTKSILAQFAGFQVFVGKELHIVEAVRHGGSGSICGMANLYPELICSLVKQPQNSHLEKLESLSRALEGIAFVPAAKSVMELRRGVEWHTIYPPLVPLSPLEKQDFLKTIQVDS